MNESQFYQVLHRSPTVIYAKVPWVDYFARQLEVEKPLAILCATNWKLSRRSIEEAATWANHQEKKYGHYVEFLLDREDEVDIFRNKYGLNVTQFNPNALCDERVYRPLSRQKKYNAVYNARPSRFKHLPLCEQIEGRWLWLTYSIESDPTIVAETMAMPNVHAPQINDALEYTGYIARDKIPGWLCQAHCGLALSSVEGSMYSSTEYLLCGLPVVAVPGECTRDQLFDEKTSIVVQPNMFRVAQTVEDAINMARHTTPETIRQITLDKMQPHRERFVGALRRAYKAVGVDYDPAYDLPHLFRHQLLIWQPVQNVLKGGNTENRQLLAVAEEEPHTRKLWTKLSGRYWESQLPAPESVV